MNKRQRKKFAKKLDRQKLEEIQRNLAAISRGALQVAEALRGLRAAMVRIHENMVAKLAAERRAS